jgi:hypothetical protein
LIFLWVLKSAVAMQYQYRVLQEEGHEENSYSDEGAAGTDCLYQ